MNTITALAVVGSFHLFNMSNLELAGLFPSLLTLTPTNSNSLGNQWHFLSFQVRQYMLDAIQTHLVSANILSLLIENNNLSSIIIVVPLFSLVFILIRSQTLTHHHYFFVSLLLLLTDCHLVDIMHILVCEKSNQSWDKIFYLYHLSEGLASTESCLRWNQNSLYTVL